MLRNEGDRLTRVIVSTPQDAYFDASTHAANNIVELADREETRCQHDALKAVMTRFGCTVTDVPELANHPNSVFPRDAALSTPEGYIKLRMGLEARCGEEEWVAAALESMGEPCVGVITAPGTVEGGDVVLAGSVAFVGRSNRTNEDGVRQLSGMLDKMGYEVRTVSLEDRYLHLGGAMSLLGPARALCCRGVFPDDYFGGFDTIEVTQRGASTGNVIYLGDGEVIANVAENAEVIGVLEDQGLINHALDLSEFRKGSGGPTCLILPVERV
jgi:dimethylargininase